MKRVILILVLCVAVAFAPLIARKIIRGDTGLGGIEYTQPEGAGYKTRK